MQVKDLILYQVATDRNYKVGDKLHFGENSNGQEYNCLNLSFNKEGVPLHELGYKHAKKGFFKNKNLILDMSKALSNYDFIMREFALEQVRKEKFPHLPSRFKCMFLSENEDECINNLQGFINRKAGKHLQAIKVKVTGEAFFVKNYGVNRLGLSFNEYKEQAFNYWSQDQNSSEKTKEILFVGDVEVVEIIKEVMVNYEDNNNKKTSDNKEKDEYFYQKSKMYYENYKAGKLTKKVGSIIKDGNKYLAILRQGKRPMFAGGSVDEGETTRDAIVREILEETGAVVKKLKYLTKEYYSVNWEFEGETFPNKRVEYTYLCEVEKGNYSAQGLKGEFEKNTTLKWCTVKELEELGMWGPTLELVKKVERENIKI